MAEEKRTIEDMLTNLFQDGQPDKSIDEQDIRDLVYSLEMPHGGLYMEGNVTTTTLTDINTWYKIAGTTTENPSVDEIDGATTNNRVIYTGAPERHFDFTATMSFISDTNNHTYEVAFSADDGATFLPGKMSRRNGVGADAGFVGVHSDVALNTDGYVELWIRDITGAGTVITAQNMRLYANGMFH